MQALVAAFVAALLIGALNTAGDFVWARFEVAHHPVFGLLHGLVLCLGVGLCLGAFRRRPARGATGGALIGLGAAGGFYLLAMLMGYTAMFVLWMALWVALGALEGRMLREPRASVTGSLVRGVLAAVGSGAAFYAISGIWQRPPSGAADYAYRFLCWSFAFLPGFAALIAGAFPLPSGELGDRSNPDPPMGAPLSCSRPFRRSISWASAKSYLRTRRR